MIHGFLVDDRSRTFASGFGGGDHHIVQDVDFGAETEGDGRVLVQADPSVEAFVADKRGLEAVASGWDALEGALAVRDGTVAVAAAVGMGQYDIGKVERLGAKAVEETDSNLYGQNRFCGAYAGGVLCILPVQVGIACFLDFRQLPDGRASLSGGCAVEN